MKTSFSIFLFLVIINLKGFSQTNISKVQNVDASTFKSMLDKKDGILIDLRTPDETKKGIIKGAKEIDFINGNFEKEADKMDKSKIYYLYCQSGGRSGDAAEYMVQHGFTHVINLQKGYGSWVKNGHEFEIKK